MEKKKVGPGRTGKLSRVIKTRLQQGGTTGSDWQKGRGLGGVCRVGMLWPKAALSPKSQRKLLPARDWLPWVRFPRPWSNQQRPGVVWPTGGADSLGGAVCGPPAMN